MGNTRGILVAKSEETDLMEGLDADENTVK
jgi:hypothetical protein